MVCLNCGKKLPDNAVFCNSCGVKVIVKKAGPSNGTVPIGRPIGSTTKQKSIKTPVIICIIAALALITSLVIIIKMNSDKKTLANDSTTEISTVDNTKSEEKTTSTEKQKKDETKIETLVSNVKLYEIKDGVFFFEGRLFGMSYDEIKSYIESLGYKFTWDEEQKWTYGSEDNITANRIDLNKKHILGFYFQDHKLVGVILEHVGVGAISKGITNTAKRAYGKCTLLSHDNKNKPYEVFCRYGKKNKNVGDKEYAGSYSAFLNPYDDINHLDQQYLSDRFDGSYLNPNYIDVKTK